MKRLNWRGSFPARNQCHSSTACSTRSIKKSRTERLDKRLLGARIDTGALDDTASHAGFGSPPSAKIACSRKAVFRGLFTTTKRVAAKAVSVLLLPLRRQCRTDINGSAVVYLIG